MNADAIRQTAHIRFTALRLTHQPDSARAERGSQGDDGVHFEATVVCDAFAGKLPLARHRMVYATLGGRMGSEIHALQLRTLTSGEAAA